MLSKGIWDWVSLYGDGSLNLEFIIVHIALGNNSAARRDQVSGLLSPMCFQDRRFGLGALVIYRTLYCRGEVSGEFPSEPSHESPGKCPGVTYI